MRKIVLVLNFNTVEENSTCLSFWMSFSRNTFWWHLISREQRNLYKVMHEHAQPDRLIIGEKENKGALIVLLCFWDYVSLQTNRMPLLLE